MAKKNRKSGKITKGMSSAVLLSIAIHAALFFLAGMLVVFTVVKKKEVEFEPPKAVERPKMKLKKPKPKVKKSARPKKAQNILAKVNPVNMPEIQLPEIGGGGLGGGLGEGIGGGFDTMPDLSEPTLFGTTQSIGNDFVGTFYDIKRDRRGKPLWSTDPGGWDWRSKINKFFLRGWDFSVFARYYRSDKKLYSTGFVVPVTLSSLVPVAFGQKDDGDGLGGLWLLHYKGQLVCPASHTNGITFRFWAAADEFMAVKVDGNVVLAMDWLRGNYGGKIIPANMWNPDAAESRQYYKGGTACEVGDWITLEPGEAVEMEMITGGNGGADHHILMVEEQGVEYELAKRGGPLLPVFRTTEFSHDKLDLIYKELPEGEMCLTNGPVFCDYDTSGTSVSSIAPEEPEPAAVEEPEDGMRTWILADGRSLEAEFVNVFGDKMVLKNAKGKIKKLSLEQFSAEDIEYAELARPPAIDINFLNSLKTVSFTGGFYDFPPAALWGRYPELHGNFGIQLKQTSAGDYNHGLEVDMFIVGQQLEGDKYLLLARQQFTFNPVEEDRFCEFRSSRKVELQNYPDYYGHMDHGDKYVGYVVTVTDKRGETIVVKSPKKWLAENLDSLKKLKVGNYFDKSCTRTFPDRPPFIPIDAILISK
ncbi:MAG: hypothetical protein ABFR33_07900 [Verrucomicrobiota bacterium]